MKASTGKYHNWMMAITFAEAGEWDTARKMMPLSPPAKKASWLQNMFMAVTFAEAGLHEEAVRVLERQRPGHHGPKKFLDAVGLAGVRVTYGVLNIEAA